MSVITTNNIRIQSFSCRTARQWWRTESREVMPTDETATGVTMGYEDGELRVQYLGQQYDVTRFRKFHPGGANTLGWFRGGDVTGQLQRTHHSPAAYSLLEDYRMAPDQPLPDKDEVSWKEF